MKYRIMIAVSAVSLVSIAMLATLVAAEKGRAEKDKGKQREEKENDGEEDDAEVVPLAKIPAAAQKALQKLAGDAKIFEVTVEDEDGVKIYEGSWKVKGVEHEAEVTANGDIIETEQVIAVGDAPKAVQKVAAKAFPKDAKVKIEKKTIVLYEVEADINGKEKEILVAPTGQRVEIDHGDDDDEDNEDED